MAGGEATTRRQLVLNLDTDDQSGSFQVNRPDSPSASMLTPILQFSMRRDHWKLVWGQAELRIHSRLDSANCLLMEFQLAIPCWPSSDPRSVELYDVESDPGEEANLATSHPKVSGGGGSLV